MSDQVFKKLAGVLSFQRGIVITDALFYDEIDGSHQPLYVHRHGIRGTQNVNKKGKGETSTSGDAARENVSNIQTTDTAKTAPDSTAVIARFGVRFIDLKDALFACAPSKNDDDAMIAALRASIEAFIVRAKEGSGVDEIARRYARNILNGRWLWRNRLIARKITVSVAVEGKVVGEADALKLSLNDFDRCTAPEEAKTEKAVAEVIASGIRGQGNAGLTVTARIDFGLQGAMEVFCSQNYLEGKPDGFARSLYCVGVGDRKAQEKTEGIRIMGQAAMRDQKVSNALRTFDTWYSEYEVIGKPIPVEPLGASLDAQRFFRSKKGSPSAFDLAKQLNNLDPESDNGKFMTACLIRGGVYSDGEAKEA